MRYNVELSCNETTALFFNSITDEARRNKILPFLRDERERKKHLTG